MATTSAGAAPVAQPGLRRPGRRSVRPRLRRRRRQAEAPAVADASADLVAADERSGRGTSPLPIASQSPTEFPLVDSGDERSWPRSRCSAARNDPALEAYLVRHNQMLANDGLGGFVPYVDVVATSEPAPAPGAATGRRHGRRQSQ